METNQPTKLKAQVPGAGSHLANATFPFDFVSSPYFWWLFSPWPPGCRLRCSRQSLSLASEMLLCGARSL